METKKTEKSNLENKKKIFFLLGLVLVLSIVLFAFEFTTKPKKVDNLGTIQTQVIEEEIIPITREQEVKPPPPPIKTIEILNIVNNDVKIDDELLIEDTEADDNTMINVMPVISTTKEEKEDETEIFFIVEDMPQFPGGELALRKFLADAIKYPVIAQENGIQGKVYVTFVVGKDGSIYNAVVARGVDPALDKEALRVINLQPKWKPGRQRNKPVNVSYTVPINFVLQ